MSRNIFISFLGTQAYLKCHYVDENTGFESSANRYIQVALLEYLDEQNIQIDDVLTFVTERAKKDNWDENHKYGWDKEHNDGLEKELKRRAHQDDFEVHAPIEIPAGFSEQEIWQQFEFVYSALEEGDQLYFDITHSFRHIPMMAMVLINYAQHEKDVSLNGIYYGAFEKLGRQVADMSVAERKAPIIDLVNLKELQDWTMGTSEFMKFGNPEKLGKVVMDELKPLLRDDDRRSDAVKLLRNSFEKLPDLYNMLVTCRGNHIEITNLPAEIIEGLKEYQVNDLSFTPLNPLIDDVIESLKRFEDKSLPRWLAAAEWCVKYKYYQQAVTYLLEGIISHFVHFFKDVPLNRKIKRNMVSMTYRVANRSTKKDDWHENLKEHEESVNSLLQNELFQSLKSLFARIRNCRNDMNHAGIRPGAMSAASLRNDIEEITIKVREKLSGETLIEEDSNTNSLMINLSNHPFESTWSEQQLEAAYEVVDEVRDMSFPGIPPEAEESELQLMVEEQLGNILKHNPSHVHIMGESTFTFRMVQQLKYEGITCLASTTEREVKMGRDGLKTSTFNFVKFRRY